MKKSNVILLVIVAIIAAGALWGIGSRNQLVTMKEEAREAYAQVEAELERRCELIPNFVATVKGVTAHESDVYTSIADARAKLSGALEEGDLAAIDEANSAFSSAYSNLLMIVEAYPELKADKNFTALQDELSGTANRIKYARAEYNEVVEKYNVEIKLFPKNIIANMCGFTEAEYFKASDEAQNVPKVEF